MARTKLLAFALAGSIASVAGVLLGYRSGRANVTGFAVSESILVLVATTLGGIATVGGAVVAALFVSGDIGAFLAVEVGASPAIADLIAGITVLNILAMSPDGLAPYVTAKTRPSLVGMRRRVRAGSAAGRSTRGGGGTSEPEGATADGAMVSAHGAEPQP